MSRTHRSSLVAAVLAVALLAGCGDDDDAAEPTTTTVVEETTTTATADDDPGDEPSDDGDVDELLDAVERTRDAGSATVEIDMHVDGGDLFASQEMRITGTTAFDGSWGDIRMHLNGTDDAVRLVILEDRAWVGGEGADVRDALPEGAEWVELPGDDVREAEGFSNPGDLAFLYLVGGASDIEVDGDTRRFDIDLDAAPESAPAELRDQVAETLSFTGERDPEVTGEVTLDDEGRIVALQAEGVQRPTADEADGLGIDPDSAIRVELAVTLTDFDQERDVEEPEGETVSLDEAPGIARLLGL